MSGLLADSEDSVSGLFVELPLLLHSEESRTNTGFMSGHLLNISSNSSTSSDAGDSPDLLFFFLFLSNFSFRVLIFNRHCSAVKM